MLWRKEIIEDEGYQLRVGCELSFDCALMVRGVSPRKNLWLNFSVCDKGYTVQWTHGRLGLYTVHRKCTAIIVEDSGH